MSDTQTIEAEEQHILFPEFEPAATTEVTVVPEQPVVMAPATPVATSESASAAVMAMIAQAASDPRVDPAKMRELLELRREVVKDEAAIEARRAYSRVCRKMPRITKHGAIDFGKGQKPIHYAKWEDVVDAIRPIYEAEEFTLSFDTRERVGGGLVVTAKLEHDNGHVITSEFPVPLDTSGGKQNIQGMGSSGSYGQRYATKNLFNLIFEGEDDDGKQGAVSFITKEQTEQISALVEEVGADPAVFLRWVFGDELPHHYAEIPADRFVKVLNALISRKNQKKAKPKTGGEA